MPNHKTRKSLLSTCSNYQIRIRNSSGIEILLKLLLKTGKLSLDLRKLQPLGIGLMLGLPARDIKLVYGVLIRVYLIAYPCPSLEELLELILELVSLLLQEPEIPVHIGDLLLKLADKGDTIVITWVDRLARSMHDLQNIAFELKSKGVALKATEQPIDTSTAAGKAFFDMLGVFAEFETNLRRERQAEGIAKAKKQGV